MRIFLPEHQLAGYVVCVAGLQLTDWTLRGTLSPSIVAPLALGDQCYLVLALEILTRYI